MIGNESKSLWSPLQIMLLKQLHNWSHLQQYATLPKIRRLNATKMVS